MDNEKQHFIDSWGLMGTVWGINNSVARVHALLLLNDRPLSLDGISKELQISRGNASTSLKELKNWGLVRLHKEPSDRQDYYKTEEDMWKILLLILRERKKREFDPLIETVVESQSALKKKSTVKVNKRLDNIVSIVKTLDMLGEKVLVNEQMVKTVLKGMSKLAK